MLTVLQALELLKHQGITDSEQTVRRWLREGKLKGTRSANRKEGWQISKQELGKFIAEIKPTLKLQQEVEILKNIIAELKAENKELREKLANVVGGNITNDNIK